MITELRGRGCHQGGGGGGAWQCWHCWHCSWPGTSRWMEVMSLMAGPSLSPITAVRWLSVSRGRHDPSIRLSENICKQQWC